MNQLQLVKPVNRLEPKFQARKKAAIASQPEIAQGQVAKSLPIVPAALQRIYFAGTPKNLSEANQIAAGAITEEQVAKETEALPWDQLLQKTFAQPQVSRNAYQRIYDLILREGREAATHPDGAPMLTTDGDQIYRYKFFQNPAYGFPIAGLEESLHELVQAFKAAAEGGEARNRYIRLDGPVGTAKSTIVTRLKRALEQYSRTDEGALYSLKWVDLPKEVAESKDLQLKADPKTSQYSLEEPMHDDPLKVIPNTEGQRDKLIGLVNEEFKRQHKGQSPYAIKVEGELSPASNLIRKKLVEYYTEKIQKGEIKLAKNETLMNKVLGHVQGQRLLLDEAKRIGIGNYTPKDPKNQDSTELNGDIDYSKLSTYGDPNHPLVQAYRGEFNVANRGLMDFEEMLKLQREFLYDVLHASQERMVKPKSGTALYTDMVIMGKTNMEELDEKLKDDKMKAFFNRAIEIPIYYLLDPKQESKIYEPALKKWAESTGVTVAPHAVEVAALWATKTRQHPEIIKNDVRSASSSVGLYGVSPRFLQNVFDKVMTHSRTREQGSVSPFTVLRVIKRQLDRGGVKDAKNLQYYYALLAQTKNDLTARLRSDVLNTFLHDETLMKSYFFRYAKELRTWSQNKSQANEAFLRRVEQKLAHPVVNAAVNEYRTSKLKRLSVLPEMQVTMDILEEDQDLKLALAKVMFEDMSQKLESAVEGGPSEADAIAGLKKAGYDEATAKEVIQHLTSPTGIV